MATSSEQYPSGQINSGIGTSEVANPGGNAPPPSTNIYLEQYLANSVSQQQPTVQSSALLPNFSTYLTAESVYTQTLATIWQDKQRVEREVAELRYRLEQERKMSHDMLSQSSKQLIESTRMFNNLHQQSINRELEQFKIALKDMKEKYDKLSAEVIELSRFRAAHSRNTFGDKAFAPDEVVQLKHLFK